MLTHTVKSKAPQCVATKPGDLPLTACRFCAGRGFQPTEGNTVTACCACDGGGWTCLAGNLGPTRTYPVTGRQFLINPGTGLMTITRGKSTESYTVKEFQPDQLPGTNPMRAFEVVRTTGVRAGEVYHLLVSPTHVSCDCAGKSWEATARADWNAYLSGAAQFKSCGCIHADATTLFLKAGLFDLPTATNEPNELPDVPEPLEPCGYCCGRGTVPGPTHDREGREIEPRDRLCEYCGGDGWCTDGNKLLPHRGL